MISVATMNPSRSVAGLPSISLVDLNNVAALQTRVDRKYVLDSDELASLVDGEADRFVALDIDGRRTFGYESVYFDTPDLECYHSAAHGRRKRFKVRTRSYMDAQTTMVEVKTKGRRKVTVKQRQPQRFEDRNHLNSEAQRFVDLLIGRPNLAATLDAVLTTRYERTTLADLDGVARLTIDADLRYVTPDGRTTELSELYVVETKSAGAPSAADRLLWSRGIRPTRISKFGTGMAALDDSLPSNKWHRTLNRYFL